MFEKCDSSNSKNKWLLLSASFTVKFGLVLVLRILTGKKNPQIKLQRFRKVWIWIWTFGWLVHQISSLYEVLNLKQHFRKTKVVTGKTPFFVISLFCIPNSVCLSIDFWQGSFTWKCCVFNPSTFKLKMVLQFSFLRKLVSKLKYWKRSKFPVIVT